MGQEGQKARQLAQEYWEVHPNLPTRQSDGAVVKQCDRCSKWVTRGEPAYVCEPWQSSVSAVSPQTGEFKTLYDASRSPDFICAACFDSDAKAMAYRDWNAYKKYISEFREAAGAAKRSLTMWTCAKCGQALGEETSLCPRCLVLRREGNDQANREKKRVNWYLANDDRRQVRQVVIQLPREGAEDSKFGSLGLARQYENLMSSSWCAGYFRTDAERGPFLLVRADGHVAHLRNCSLQAAFSFYREPAGGLFGVFVAAESSELRRASPTGHAVFECIYGLDFQDAVDRIQEALSRDVIHLCCADAATNLSADWLQPDGTFKKMNPPACQFDRAYPVPADCRQALTKEFRDLIEYHRSLSPSSRDYQRSQQELSADFPSSEHPILSLSHTAGKKQTSFWKRLFRGAADEPRSTAPTSVIMPFDKLKHVVIFARHGVESFNPSDEMLRVLEEMTGRTIEEVRHKAKFQLFRNSGYTIDAAKKGELVSIIAATELAIKGDADSLAEKAERAVAGAHNASERYFRDSSSGEDFAIVLLYGT